jgi:hypothetical protein
VNVLKLMLDEADKSVATASVKLEAAHGAVRDATNALAAFDSSDRANNQAIAEDQASVTETQHRLEPAMFELIDQIDTVLLRFHHDLSQIDNACQQRFPGYKNTVNSNYFPSH